MSEDEERTRPTPRRPEGGGMSESEVDRNLEDTFPASDPPSWTLGTDHVEDAPDERG
ncbi:MAG: hypothetical protein M3416_11215 [Acidobacteriota bacterium]|nr:hypothetical protein [Acidobacteriota bacterium]